MPDEKIKELKERAKELRKTAVTMIYEAQSGHPGGSLSAADIVAALYFSEMHVDPKDPKWPDRDRFVLSKGHVCPIQYAALGKLGFFPEEDLHTLRQEGSKLQGHPSMLKCPGIDISTGSLGQGTACAVGMALAGKRDGRDYRVFDMVGDGELDEGIIWEAMMTAHKYELDNFIMILDNNVLQLLLMSASTTYMFRFSRPSSTISSPKPSRVAIISPMAIQFSPLSSCAMALSYCSLLGAFPCQSRLFSM